MSLPSTSYTPAGGYTPQGQQNAQSQPNATNTQAPAGNPALGYMQNDLSQFPSDQSLSSSYQGANANLVKLGTADTRQQYITNSNLPGMYQNYDDLAKKLFEYDQGTLNPQFQGQNPGTPSDAASFGRVDASPLGLTMNAAGLPASSGLFNNNPKYAYTAQTATANNLSNLMDTLNKGIGDTLGARMGTYRSDRQAAIDALDSVFKVMGLKKEVSDSIANQIEKQLDRQEKAAERASSRGDKTSDKTQAIWDQLYGNAKTEYDIWKAINENQDAWRSSGIDVDQLWRWHKNLASRIGKGATTGQGLKEKNMSAKEKDTVIGLQSAYDTIQEAKKNLDKTGSGPQYVGWEARQYLPGTLGLGEAAGTATSLASANESLFKVAGTAFTGSERKLLESNVLNLSKNKEVNMAALKERERVLKAKLQSYGVTVGSTSSQESGTTVMVSPSGQMFNVSTSEVNEAKKNGWRTK